MAKYTNNQYCFQIDFPDNWGKSSGLARIPVFLSNTISNANILEEFTNKKKEFINIVVETMRPEIPPDITEMLFYAQALDSGYTGIEFGRIHIEGRDHTWATYVMAGKGWLKKYMIVVNGYGYAFTASCPIEQRSKEVEKGWDRIAASFKLTKPLDQDVLSLNASYETQRAIAALRREAWMQLEKRKRTVGL